VATLIDHDYGSEIPVRYDPSDHSNAVPLVDRPADDLPVSIGFYIVTIGVLVWVFVYVRRRRRRNHAALENPMSKRTVTFEAWRRSCGDASQHYLVLFDAAAETAEPLCCVPVAQRTLRRLEPNDVLQLYESGDVGSPAALRREGNVILPTADVRPGSWELAKRRK
jgi:hypothetical protein